MGNPKFGCSEGKKGDSCLIGNNSVPFKEVKGFPPNRTQTEIKIAIYILLYLNKEPEETRLASCTITVRAP